jgi:hypothetical protein
MKNKEFSRLMKSFAVEGGLTASSLRNQGAPGVLTLAREYCKIMDIKDFMVDDEPGFQTVLDCNTKFLMNLFPMQHPNWGAARKAINIVLRDHLYNRFLCDYYGMASIEEWLEVPLDRDVTNGLLKDYSESLPIWSSIKKLNPIDSREFQIAAKIVASEMYNISRVHLDLIYWRAK